MNQTKPRLHSSLALSFMLIIIFVSLSSSQTQMFLKIYLVGLLFLFYAGLPLKRFFKTTLQVALFAGFYFAFFIIYAPAGNLDKAFSISARLFVSSFLSISALSVIDHEECLLYFCQKKIIPAKFAYPLLLALNSVAVFQRQLKLIQYNAKLRRLKGWLLPHILFQFIVFSLRFSEAGALSVYLRHLNEDKEFYYKQTIQSKDWIVLSLFIFILFGLYFS